MKNRDVFPPLIFSACTKRGWCSILTIFSKRPGLAEALTRQEPFINQNLAYQALGMLTQLLRHGSLSYQGGFCNLASGQVAPLPVRFAELKFESQRRRRSRIPSGGRRVVTSEHGFRG